MNRGLSPYWLFYSLGAVFLLFNLSFEISVLICAFYAFFVGTVWGLVSRISAPEPLRWQHLLPPFLLMVLMMFTLQMRMVPYSDTIFMTAMALIHFRASVVVFARLSKNGLVISAIQFISFVLPLIFVFQKNILPIPIPRNVFLSAMMILGGISIGLLLIVKRKFDEVSAVDS